MFVYLIVGTKGDKLDQKWGGGGQDFGQDFQSTLDRLRDVLTRLRAEGLKLNHKKCDLFKKRFPIWNML